jgi:hypothetical protein
MRLCSTRSVVAPHRTSTLTCRFHRCLLTLIAPLTTARPSFPAGTREIWLRAKEIETEKRKSVEFENKINTVMHELQAREGLIKEQNARIEAQAKMLAEAERKMKAYESLYAGTCCSCCVEMCAACLLECLTRP